MATLRLTARPADQVTGTYLADALDVGDTFNPPSHPGATVIPAAIAEAERTPPHRERTEK